MLGLGSNISKTGKLGIHDLGIVTSNLVLKHNYDLSSVQLVSDGAAVFDGTSDYISMSSKIVDTADATYCIWVKSTDVNNAILFSHSGGATAEGHKTGAFASNHGTTGKPLLYLNDSLYQYWDDSGLADDGKWHHWAIVVDVDDMTACKLYIDGVLQSQSSRATSDSANSYGNLRIGSYTSDGTTDQFIGGYMCNFGVWTGFLSQAQIKSIMWKNYAGLTSSEKTDLVSWWNLDSVIPDTTTFVYDNHHDDGDTLGSELVTNGDFTNGLTGWTKGTPASTTMTLNSENQMVMTESGEPSTYLGAFTPIDLTEGNTYIFQYDVISSDNVSQLRVGTAGPSVDQYSHSNILYTGTNPLDGTPPTTKIVYFVADSSQASDNYLYIGGRDDVDSLVVDNVSLKLVNGNTGTLA